MTKVLKAVCASNHRRSSIYSSQPNEGGFKDAILSGKYIAEAYINRHDFEWWLLNDILTQARYLFGKDPQAWLKKCDEFGTLADCVRKDSVDTLRHKEFMQYLSGNLIDYYNDHNLCLKVLFSSN